MTMQLLIVVLQTKTVEFGLTIAAIPVVLLLIGMCRWAVEREIRVYVSTLDARFAQLIPC